MSRAVPPPEHLDYLQQIGVDVHSPSLSVAVPRAPAASAPAPAPAAPLPASPTPARSPVAVSVGRHPARRPAERKPTRPHPVPSPRRLPTPRHLPKWWPIVEWAVALFAVAAAVVLLVMLLMAPAVLAHELPAPTPVATSASPSPEELPAVQKRPSSKSSKPKAPSPKPQDGERATLPVQASPEPNVKVEAVAHAESTSPEPDTSEARTPVLLPTPNSGAPAGRPAAGSVPQQKSSSGIETVVGMDSFMFWNPDWMGVLTRWLLRLLIWLHDLFNVSYAYGLAIIAITLAVKLLFWPLTHHYTNSMRKMQALQPQLKELREKYKERRTYTIPEAAAGARESATAKFDETMDMAARLAPGDALVGFSETIAEGEVVAIAGPSGCGKTTLARLLARVYDCEPGSYQLAYDLDSDGIFDRFYSNRTSTETTVKHLNNGNYAIDIDGDGDYDIVYNTITNQYNQYTETSVLEYFFLILLIIAVLLIYYFLRVRKQTRTLRHQRKDK